MEVGFGLMRYFPMGSWSSSARERRNAEVAGKQWLGDPAMTREEIDAVPLEDLGVYLEWLITGRPRCFCCEGGAPSPAPSRPSFPCVP